MTSFSDLAEKSPGSPSPSQHELHLAHLQERVLTIVTDIIKKKRYILLDKLMAIAARETKSGRAEIERVVDDLIRNKIIVPGSRLIRKNILKNPLRQEIYLLVKSAPGINLNSIKGKLDLGSREVAWHLSVLIKFGCLQKINYKNTFLFALPQIQSNQIILHFLLRREIMGSILTKLSRAESSLADLVTQVGEEKTKILYNLNQLLDLNIIEKKTRTFMGREVVYCVERSYRDPLVDALIL
jgi:predicted transcriptional regulator